MNICAPGMIPWKLCTEGGCNRSDLFCASPRKFADNWRLLQPLVLFRMYSGTCWLVQQMMMTDWSLHYSIYCNVPTMKQATHVLEPDYFMSGSSIHWGAFTRFAKPIRDPNPRSWLPWITSVLQFAEALSMQCPSPVQLRSTSIRLDLPHTLGLARGLGGGTGLKSCNLRAKVRQSTELGPDF